MLTYCSQSLADVVVLIYCPESLAAAVGAQIHYADDEGTTAFKTALNMPKMEPVLNAMLDACVTETDNPVPLLQSFTTCYL